MNKLTYPAGVPCWVETLQPDARAALEFYGGVFGWNGVGPGRTPDGGEYYVAKVDGDDVAGIAPLPRSGDTVPVWSTQIRVDDVDAAAQRIVAAGGSVIVPPFDALPAGRGAVFSDPCGAAFGVWEARDREGAQRINAPRAWAMSSLFTSEPERANAFYRAVFGWTAEPLAMGDAKGALYRLTGYVGGTPQQPVPRDVVAVVLESDANRPSYWGVDFWIDDTDAAAARAEKLGGTIVTPPFDAPMFRRAVIADRAGAVFSISQFVGAPG